LSLFLEDWKKTSQKIIWLHMNWSFIDG
jgi:hypothetical protein